MRYYYITFFENRPVIKSTPCRLETLPRNNNTFLKFEDAQIVQNNLEKAINKTFNDGAIEINNCTLGMRLKRIRGDKKRRILKNALNKFLNNKVTADDIELLEDDLQLPNMNEIIKAYSKVFNVSIDYIFKGE